MHVFRFTVAPVPKKVYHTPGAELSVVVHVAGASAAVAPTVVPLTGVPQVRGMAPPHRLLVGGVVHVMLMVNAPVFVPNPVT